MKKHGSICHRLVERYRLYRRKKEATHTQLQGQARVGRHTPTRKVPVQGRGTGRRRSICLVSTQRTCCGWSAWAWPMGHKAGEQKAGGTGSKAKSAKMPHCHCLSCPVPPIYCWERDRGGLFMYVGLQVCQMGNTTTHTQNVPMHTCKVLW